MNNKLSDLKIILIGELRKFLGARQDIEKTRKFYDETAHKIIFEKKANWGIMLNSSLNSIFTDTIFILYPLFERLENESDDNKTDNLRLISAAYNTAISLVIRNILPTNFITKNKNTENSSVGNIFEYLAQTEPNHKKIRDYFKSIDPNEQIISEKIWFELNSEKFNSEFIYNWTNSYYNMQNQIKKDELGLIGFIDLRTSKPLTKAIISDLCSNGLINDDPEVQLRKLIDRYREYKQKSKLIKNTNKEDRIYFKQLIMNSHPVTYKKNKRTDRGRPKK